MHASAATVTLGFCLAALVSALTTPVGVSGAVFLLPVQVSVLKVPSPSVTPTNLMFNLFATPAGLVTYWRQGQVDLGLARVLLVGTVPGVVVGAWLRVEHLSGAVALRLFLGLFLIPIGLLLLRRRGAADGAADRPPPRLPGWLGPFAAVVGVIGGLIGVGGGSVLAPVLAGLGLPLARVAPAALLTTFVTSVVGVATFAVLAATGAPAAAPDWLLGVALGLGGIVGSIVGARAQPHLPERGLRTFLAVAALAVGVTYVLTALALR